METQTQTPIEEKPKDLPLMPADDLGDPEQRESSSSAQMSQAEIKASELGWKPRTEYKGDPMTFVEAEEYLKRAPLYQELGKQKKRNRELAKGLEQTMVFSKKQFETGYRKAMSELQAQKKEQIELGNVQKVEEIDQQIDQLKKEAADTPPVVSAADSVVEDWKPNNPWFGPDEARTALAIELYKHYGADANPDTEGLLNYISYTVEKKFGPYEGVAKPGDRNAAMPKGNGNAARTRPAAVEGGGLPTGGTHKFGYSDLSDLEKKVCSEFVKRGDMTRDEYVKAIEEQRKQGV